MFSLEEITTKDGVIHQGLVAWPEKEGKTAFIWVHGLTGDFYSNTTLLSLFAENSNKKDFAFASFNNRGHDMIAGFRKIDTTSSKGYSYATIGAGFEIFEECVYDIDAAVDFFVQKGYKKIVLLGHSSGANKVSYYAGVVKNVQVSGVVLMCPMSDRLDPSVNKEKIQENIKKCFTLIEQGREDALITGMHFFPMTAKRYISLVTPNTSEDQFGYGDDPPVLKDYEQIKVPLYVLFAEKDEYADRPMVEIKKIFDLHQKSSLYSSHIIPEVFHNLVGKEKEIIEEIFTWVEKIA